MSRKIIENQCILDTDKSKMHVVNSTVTITMRVKECVTAKPNEERLVNLFI